MKTFKFSIERVESSPENKAKIKTLFEKINVLGKAFNSISNVFGRTQLIDDMCEEYKHLKTQLKKQYKVKTPKYKLKIHSERKWKFFEETIDDATGITKYSEKPVELFVSEELEIHDGENRLEKFKQLKQIAREKIQAARKKRREISFIEKDYTPKTADGVPLPFTTKYKVYAGGGYAKEEFNQRSNHSIHLVPGEIMRLKAENKIRDVFTEKEPKTSENHVGIEIEFISKMDRFELAKLLADKDVQGNVTLKTDASLRREDDYPYTHELCVLVPESQVDDVMRKVTDALDIAGCKVNRRCGLHVHLDMRNRNKHTVFRNLVKSQRILFDMNPVSRLKGDELPDGNRDTAWSKLMTYNDFDEAVRSIGGDRYFGINPLSMERHETIEVRLHSGSTNFTKITNWVKILVAIANHKRMFNVAVTKPEMFCKRFNLDDEMLSYIKERIAKFKDANGNHVTVDEVA